MPTFEAGEAGEYLDALNKHNAAIRKYEIARNSYRAKQLDDDTFLAAKATYDAATAEFDKAYEKAGENAPKWSEEHALRETLRQIEQRGAK